MIEKTVVSKPIWGRAGTKDIETSKAELKDRDVIREGGGRGDEGRKKKAKKKTYLNSVEFVIIIGSIRLVQ